MPVWSIFYVLSGYNNHLSQKKLFCHIKIQLIFVTTLIVWILILHNIFHSPSCPEGFKVSFYNLNHVILFSFEQDTIQKPLFSYFLQEWVHLGRCVYAFLSFLVALESKKWRDGNGRVGDGHDVCSSAIGSKLSVGCVYWWWMIWRSPWWVLEWRGWE